jgi:tRNA(fMet)-specific endonuclease VapC
VTAVVLDTNILSYKIKQHAISRLYTARLLTSQLVISFQTLAELQVWGRDSGWGEKRWAEFSQELEAVNVIYASEVTCGFFARARVSAKRAGRPIAPADAWVAATALELDLPLVTHNPSDFVGVTGLEIISAV